MNRVGALVRLKGVGKGKEIMNSVMRNESMSVAKCQNRPLSDPF